MLNVHTLLASSDFAQITEGDDHGLQQKLSLYQVFLRLYEQNRTLLDEILKLEHASIGNEFVRSSPTQYLQGIVIDGRVGLVTNLMTGLTQTVFQAQNIWTIGRDRRKAAIPVLDSRLSRCHAAITYCQHRQMFQLIDFDSTNGSFVNGEQIRKCHLLQDGDRIRLGTLSFIFFACVSVREADQVSEDVVSHISPCLDNEDDRCRERISSPQQAQHRYIEDDERLAEDQNINVSPGETLMFLRHLS